MVPLANMFGYINTLRSMSQGRAQYTMHFDHYAPKSPRSDRRRNRQETGLIRVCLVSRGHRDT